jgi:hypothetical protein
LTGDCGTLVYCKRAEFQKDGKDCFNYECVTDGKIDKVEFFDEHGASIALETTEPWWLGGNDGERLNCLTDCPWDYVKVVGYNNYAECFKEVVHPCEPDEPKEPKKKDSKKDSKKKDSKKKDSKKKDSKKKDSKKDSSSKSSRSSSSEKKHY